MLKKKVFLLLFLSFISFNVWAAYDFDHSDYDSLLKDVVVQDAVNYQKLKFKHGILEAYLQRIAKMSIKDFRAMTREQQMALYINAYNAYTLKAIIDNYPVKSIKKIPKVWDKPTAVVAGTNMSLNDIEHGTLRPYYKEPRLHFALNCASIGCPQLRAEAYTAEKLEQQLDDAAYIFMNDRKRNPYHKKKNRFMASSIFKWFEDDFGNIREFISSYLDEDKVAFDLNKPKIRFQYNWRLNDV